MLRSWAKRAPSLRLAIIIQNYYKSLHELRNVLVGPWTRRAAFVGDGWSLALAEGPTSLLGEAFDHFVIDGLV